MIYDFIAAFYENANDKEPRFRVPLGTFKGVETQSLLAKGFTEVDGTQNWVTDYQKEVQEDELQEWTFEGYDPCEILTVLDGRDFGRIVINAYELEKTDDEGNIPARGIHLNLASVTFTGNSHADDIVHIKENGGKHRHLEVPLVKLLRHFDVLTMFEVMDKMQKLLESHSKWTFGEFKNYLEEATSEHEKGHLALNDLTAVYPDVFVRTQDKDRGDELALIINNHSQGQVTYYFQLLARWEKFSYAPYIDDFKDLSNRQEEMRSELRQECSDSAIRQILDDFASELHKWELLENKWDYNLTDIFHCDERQFGNEQNLFFIAKAIEIANQAFDGHKDKDGNPAVYHALKVGLAGKTPEEQIVGFLHDVVEDTDWTFDYLRHKGFHESIITALKLLTHDKVQMSYTQYVQNIIDSGNQLAINVKLNDLHHNLERGRAYGHQDTVAKHEMALEMINAHLAANTKGK